MVLSRDERGSLGTGRGTFLGLLDLWLCGAAALARLRSGRGCQRLKLTLELKFSVDVGAHSLPVFPVFFEC